MITEEQEEQLMLNRYSQSLSGYSQQYSLYSLCDDDKISVISLYQTFKWGPD